MSKPKQRSVPAVIVGLLVLSAGLAAFLVPLQHAGPYPGRYVSFRTERVEVARLEGAGLLGVPMSIGEQCHEGARPRPLVPLSSFRHRG